MNDRNLSFRKPKASVSRRMRSVFAIIAGFIILSMISAWADPLRRIVEFETTTSETDREQIIAASGSTLLRHLPLIHSASIVLPENNPEGALAVLTSAAEVVAVHADAALNAQSEFSAEGVESPAIALTPPPSPGEASWNQEMIDHDHLDINLPGDGIYVAVVDTGVDPSHPALSGRVAGGYNAVTSTGTSSGCVAEGASAEGAEAEGAEAEGAEAEGAEAEGAEAEGAEAEGAEAEGAENAIDCNGHGTHVAGIIAADTVGIAPHVQLYSVRVLNRHGGGFVSDLIDGLSWIHERPHIRVVNMSLGFYKTGTYPLLRRVIQILDDAGVTLVAAVGNYRFDCMVGSGDDKRFEIYGDGCNTRVKFPARYRETLAVGGSNANDDIAHYSIHGPEIDLIAPGGTALTPVISTHSAIAANSYNSATSAEGAEAEGAEAEGAEAEGAEAEGAEVGYYGASSGTSMAAPHVAGVVALLLQANPNLTPADVRAILQSTAHELPDVPRSAQGAGRINAQAAVAAAAGWSTTSTEEYVASTDSNTTIEMSFLMEDNVDIDNLAYVHINNNIVLNTNVTLGEGVTLHNKAELGTNVAVGYNSEIQKNSQVGSSEADMYGVTIGDDVFIDQKVQIGLNVLIGHHTQVYDNVRIGNRVTIGEGVHIHSKAQICEGEVIADGVVIPSNAKVGTCPWYWENN